MNKYILKISALIVFALTSTPSFAADVRGYECFRSALDGPQLINCGPWKDNKPYLVFESVTDLYAKGYRVIAAYFVPEHVSSPKGTRTSPSYEFIIESR